MQPEPEVVVDAREFCGFAAGIVTRGYRTGLGNAKAVDEAHGRLVARTHLRGTVPADDADVARIMAAAVILDEAERARLHVQPESDFDDGPVDPDLRERALEKLDGKPFIGDLLRQRREGQAP